MSGLGLMLPSTSSVIRPFGPTDVRRPMSPEEPLPPSTPPAMRKRKYDFTEPQYAPIRVNMIARLTSDL